MDNYGALASPTQNKLKTPSGLGKLNAPVIIPDASAAARVPGTPMVAAKANALKPAAAPQMSPYAAPKKPLQNALLGSAVDGFMRGFAPQQREADIERRKTEGVDKMKKTLALIEQQRALPMEQRAQWWEANVDGVSEIMGQDMRAMPVDPNQFSDQALDGHRAMLSAQLGIAPEKPKPMNAYEAELIRLKEEEANKPIIASAGQRGFQDVDGDGKLDEIFSVPGNAADGSDLENGGVQSIKDLDDGRMLITYRSGKTEVAIDPASGSPAIARQSFGTFMAGDTPYLFNRNTGAPSVQQVVAPEKVGQDASTVAGVQALGKAAIDAKIQLPAAASQLNNIIGAAEQLRASPGFKGLYGGPVEAAAGMAGARFGSDAEAQAIVDQIGGEAFLNAIQSLKGSGPVSEREGLAAQAAQSRLRNYNQSDEAAQKALDDFIERSSNVYLLQMLKARVPFSNEQLASLSPRQKALIAEWARFEGAQ